MKVIGFLPIKANSARVPRKNFRMLGDCPLWVHAARNLLAVPAVSHIVIDTDVPKEFNNFYSIGRVLVRERPKSVQGDQVDTNKVIRPFVEETDADVIVQIHATSPFVDPRRFSIGLSTMAEKSEINSIMAVTRHSSRFSYRGEPVNHTPGELIPTQKLVPLFEDNSAFYMFRKKAFLDQGHRTPTKCLTMPFGGGQNKYPPAWEVIDIDTESEWDLAEAIASWKKSASCLKHGSAKPMFPCGKGPSKLSGEATF